MNIGNQDAEIQILGNIINNSNLIEQVKDYGEELFINTKCKKLYKKLYEMYINNETVDLLTVSEKFRGDKTFLPSEISDISTNSIDSQFYSAVDLAKKEADKLRILKFRESIDANESIDKLVSKVSLLQSQSNTFSFEGGTSLLNSLYDDIEILFNSKRKKYISTGFKDLDYKIGGGLYPGLYVLGAGSSIGKTTFVQQVTDHIASNGKKVLFFSLEMGKKEMIAKTVARELYKTDFSSLGTRQLLNGDLKDNDWALLAQSTGVINKIVKDIYYVEGNFGTTVEDIVNKSKLFKAKYKESPIVVVDYLQIISPCGNRMTDKQNADKNIAELKRLSRDLDTTVIAISSINRQSYLSYIDFSSFKESGSIEYGADVVIGLQLKVIHEITQLKDTKIDERRTLYNTAKAQNIREVELVILKNRNGISTGTLDYDYNPKYNLFTELEYKVEFKKEQKKIKI